MDATNTVDLTIEQDDPAQPLIQNGTSTQDNGDLGISIDGEYQYDEIHVPFEGKSINKPLFYSSRFDNYRLGS